MATGQQQQRQQQCRTTIQTTSVAQYEIILMTISVNCHLRARNVVFVLQHYVSIVICHA